MKSFNVIIYDFNAKKFVEYDVMPYLVGVYFKNKERGDKMPETFEEFKEFVKSESQYQFWARCEYEMVLVDWPCKEKSEKWDVHKQLMMNIDTVTKILKDNVWLETVKSRIPKDEE